MNPILFQLHLNSPAVYCSDIDGINKILKFTPRFYKDRQGNEYMNTACSFDIETTSDSDGERDFAYMYIWQLGINGYVIYGRTWKEFMKILSIIQDKFSLNEKRFIVFYVHNLQWEFQFIRKRFEWSRVFSVKERKPVIADTTSGIEFRCSYMLTGKSLAKVGDDLTEFNVRKMVGDLDYELKRNYKTPLTEKELEYCFNDVRVVMALIQEKIHQDGSITKIPMTLTGYVRKHIRNACLHENGDKKISNKKFLQYRKLMDKMQLTPERYYMLKNAFQGGFTHANSHWVGKTLDNIHSFDFTSSYPFVMLSRKFPMNGGEEYKPLSYDDFYKNLNLYCCLFTIELFDVIPKLDYDHPISIYKCCDLVNYSVDNGRLIKADHLVMTITEQDFFIYEKFYQWKKMNIHKFIRYQRDYLPYEYVKAILELYVKKTQLKGVVGKEVDYLLSKGMLNSSYGMMCTDICRPSFDYIDEWDTSYPDIEKEIEKYNKSLSRFTSYEWG